MLNSGRALLAVDVGFSEFGVYRFAYTRGGSLLAVAVGIGLRNSGFPPIVFACSTDLGQSSGDIHGTGGFTAKAHWVNLRVTG